ncbi:MAG: DNA-3-methyladenine glycosylase [Candidatus Sumerlaeales bacterium]|nr:DNA-3-methyladenine glycosylase [Candidatus Sumerlaeales bacterium]
MRSRQQISRAWLARPTLTVARQLLGCYLVHDTSEGVYVGRIVETEAYCGPEDKGAHSSGGKRTKRNEVMFGEAGHAYVYLIYGMYWCVNVTTDLPSRPHAVLIRALQPVQGIDLMRKNSPGIKKENDLCKGPGRLCRAMDISGKQYGLALFEKQSSLCLCKGKLLSTEDVQESPRIGIPYAEEYADLPWRFSIHDNPCVSR